jgi:ABC-type polysaccharide/polyol phosphate export permease
MTTASTLREVWRFREVVKNFVSQDLKVKYRRSFLGFFWSLLNPLLQMAVISLVFSMLFKFPVRNYALYVLSGLVPWGFLAASIEGCTMSIVSAEGMLKRQYFPKLVFPLSVVMQNLVTFTLSLVVLVCVLAPITGFKLSASLLILPFSFLFIVSVALGIGAVAAVLTVYFRDVQHLIAVFISVWFYATPIIWPLESKQPARQVEQVGEAQVAAGADEAAGPGVDGQSGPGDSELVDVGPIPHQYRFWFKLNPIYSIIEMFHRPIYDARFPTRAEFLSAMGMAVVSLVIGFAVFRRYENSLIFHL